MAREWRIEDYDPDKDDIVLPDHDEDIPEDAEKEGEEDADVPA